MRNYEIANTESGVILGVYEGETAADAIRAMLADAGCTDEPDAGLVAREVDDALHAWDSEEYAYADGDADGIDDYFTVASFLSMFGGTAPSSAYMSALRAAAHAALDDDDCDPSPEASDGPGQGWVACDPDETAGEWDATQTGPLRASCGEAQQDRSGRWPAVRRVGRDGWLYVD